MTGASGMLGRRLVPALLDAGHEVRLMSRRETLEIDVRSTVMTADLATGKGVRDAVTDVETVVHAATSPVRGTRRVDVEGTNTLLEIAGDGGVTHVVFPSIVGVDRHPFPYYRAKWEAEQTVEHGEVPWTILRATQFHDLLDQMFRALTRLPLVPVPRGFVFQPIDVDEVVARLVEVVEAGPSRRVPDLAGPEVRSLPSLLRAWLRARERRRLVVPLPVPGKIARAMREGVHTNADRAVGTVSWEEFLGEPPLTPEARRASGKGG